MSVLQDAVRPNVVAAAGRELDFIYVGTPKAGSSWLFEALREHPDARVLPSKSSKYFETESPGPIGDYRKLLARLEPGGKAGEIAHDVYIVPGAAQRLRDAFPNVRILVCLREPGEFVQSMLQWLATHTNLHGDSVDSIMANPRIQVLMDYAGQLEAFFELFPHEQVKVVFFDELQDDAARFWRDVCEFLGIDPEFRPSVLDEIVNPARPPRLAVLNRLLFQLGVLVRRAGFGGLVERAKRWPLLEWLLYANGSQGDPTVLRASAQARADAKPTFDELERLIGKPLPQGWREA